MAPVLAPWQAGRELLCCLYLGGLVGALRALAPARGRGAVLPDMALVGMLLLFLQSYAAGYSDAGSLRWYMAAAGFLGAGLAQALLGPPAALLRRLLLWPGRALSSLLARGLLRPARLALSARCARRRAARSEKTAAENQKKNLQNTPHLLYNSNV